MFCYRLGKDRGPEGREAWPGGGQGFHGVHRHRGRPDRARRRLHQHVDALPRRPPPVGGRDVRPAPWNGIRTGWVYEPFLSRRYHVKDSEHFFTNYNVSWALSLVAICLTIQKQCQIERVSHLLHLFNNTDTVPDRTSLPTSPFI